MLKSTIQDMEKERDFYFGKLRNIELICQEKEGEGDPTLQRIIDILYATDVSSPAFMKRLLTVRGRVGVLWPVKTRRDTVSHLKTTGSSCFMERLHLKKLHLAGETCLEEERLGLELVGICQD